MRRNRFTHILTWALVTVLAVQSFLPSCAYALEMGRIQRLAEAIATYRSGSAVAIDAGVTVRTSDKMSEGVASGELSTSAETPEEGSATSEPAAEGEPATSTTPNDGAGADGDAGGLDDPAQDESTAAEDAAAIEGAEVLSDGGDGSGKVLLADADAVDGRDYSGQVTKTINGTTYILIGNEQQLRAIGSNKPVIGGPVYQIEQQWNALRVRWEDVEGAQPTLVYPGDADLDANTGLRGEEMPDDGGGRGIITQHTYKYFTYDDAGKRDDSVEGNDRINTGLTYSADADYIIFRDIDLDQEVAGDPENNLWTPLMFSGTMIGAVADPDGSIWSEDASAIVATTNPVISHVDIEQTGKINQSKQLGVGFFAMLTPGSQLSSTGATSKEQVKVSSITLRNVDVDNQADGVEQSVSLVGGLLSGVGHLLQGLYNILDGLLLGVLPDLDDFLGGLLDIYETDPSALATGAFAGSIIGDVAVDDCIVEQAKVTSVNGSTGGFVGYASGDTEYSFLGTVAGALVNFVSELLNVIPFLGLGDLITVLLDNNIIKADELLPTNYISPVITNSMVKELNTDGTALGSDEQNAAGGFVGMQIGTIIRGSKVENSVALTVRAKKYAGGFAGVMHDGQIKGLLENLGVNLGLDNAMGLNPQSLTEGSSVSAPTLTVTAANRAGGFVGAMAASYAVNSSVAADAKLNVSTTESYAGGFAGQMTMGWATNLGVNDGAEDLLGGLSSLITNILKSGDNSGQLLTLAGFEPSAALGCGVSGGSVAVDAKGSYAGGFTGAGEGAVIAKSDADHVNALTHWQNGGALAGTTVEARNIEISGLSTVSAASLAGGIAGEMETAAIGGLLNNTLGIGSLKDLANGGFTAFEVSDAVVTGVDGGFTVAVTDYNGGGAIGLATGGEVLNVKVNNLGSVTGTGEVGGFIGQAAAGSALGADGINLLGLVKLSGLLTVAQTTHLDVSDSNVNGIGTGFTVTASGKTDAAETEQFTAGGFYGRASSMTTTDSHVTNLKNVKAPEKNGMAGGFVGLSTTGGLAQIVSDEDESSDILKQLIDGGLLSVDDLLGAVPYMVPSYRCTDVTYVAISDGYNVKGDVAGGYAGLFESGEVNVFDEDHPLPDGSKLDDLFAVRNIASVYGEHYAGGFAGKAVSGSLAEAGGGLSLLGGAASIDLTKLLDLVQAYVPVIRYADVLSEDGFTVETAAIDSQEQTTSGAAGGFIGYGAAVQVSYSDVNRLAHTAVAAPDDLEASEASSYFDRGQSAYAVTAPQYAGGYFGYLNIGSTAGVASGLELLKNSPLDGLTRGISVSDLTSALNVMASTVEHSSVYGHAGGFSVLASGTDSFGAVGHAGGFAGKVSGGQIQDCNVDNFAYIIGQIAAGGYAGEIEPGSVAEVLGEATTGEGGILDGLLGVNDLASLAQAFIPTIRNSQTTCVPCGGAVRAQALSTKDGTDGGGSPIAVQRGMAGGYVGHNLGGQIWGNNNAAWKSENGEDGAYNGPQREAAAIRIRSVYGAEYAGGFTGLMEPGSTAETGGLSLLWGLINTNNLLNVMQDIYPTEENTAVYGPLRGLDKDTWNAWVDAVGVDNVYGELLGEKDEAAANGLVGHVDSDDEIAAWLAKIGYGTNVVAGRDAYEAGAYTGSAGVAGGYVGSMVAGTITNGQAHDTKLVRAMRAAGGFVGAAETGGAAKLGSVDILGLTINAGDLLPSLVSVFVPVIKCSSVTGYRQGMTVESFGSAPADGEGQHETDTKNGTGFAGGYIGFGSGAQIWGDADTARNGNAQPVSNAGCTVSGLRRVSATAYAGGFAGKLCAASVASADTNVSDGFLQGLLDKVIGGTSIKNLAEVLQASMSTVRNAHVKAAATDADGAVIAGDAQWGFTIDAYTTGEGDSAQKVYPIAAGGFAGSIEATVLGELTTNGDDPDAAGGDNLNLPVNKAKGVSVSGLRGVDGGNFAGGLVGLADVAGAADVASGDTEGAGASVLKLIGLGGVSVLQAFQPCIYAARVDGVADGLTVRAHEADTGGLLTAERRSGNAGGFIGSIMSGAVRESSLTNLSTVFGPSYTGGFIGYTGKSGVLDVEDASLLERLIGLDASAVNTFSTLVQNSTVAGIPAGYTVASTGSDVSEGEDAWQISGGFVGYADLAHITGCRATALKRVGSGEVAGGFAGKGTHAYLVSAEADSPLVKAILLVVSELVRVLWLEDLQGTNLIDIDLSDWVLHLQVEGEGDTLKVSLLGIPIEVTLNDENAADNFAVAHVKIGSSTIDLNVSKDDQDNVTIDEKDASNIAVNLIKANMTVIEDSTVTGIADGYDVFAGGATQTTAAMDTGTSDAESGFAGGFMGWSDEAQLKNNEMLYADVVKGTAGLVAPFAGRTDYDPAHKLDTVDKQITGNTYHVYRGTELAGETLSGTIIQQREDSSVAIQGKLDNGDPATDGTASSAEDAAWARFDIKGHKPVAGKSNHGDWKDAAAGDAPLDVWRDEGSTAVLMANAAVSDNTGVLTPEPEEGQDPCAATADLTITKVWDDHGDALHRPESIEVELWQSYTDANGKVVRKPYDGMLPNNGGSDGSGITSPNITLSAAEASPWSNTWQHVVKMLPVAWDDNGTIRYFSYSVKEVTLDGGGKDIADYSTTITPGEDGSFHIVITNRLPLPNTGGAGNIMLLLAGLATLAMGGVWFESRRRRQHAAAPAEAARPAGRHFAPRER
ncbi:putative uncharacterized protein [Collinsella sp. CAG:398]|nr:putative uncharacterized protein [Collinsella sp. CAG:398]